MAAAGTGAGAPRASGGSAAAGGGSGLSRQAGSARSASAGRGRRLRQVSLLELFSPDVRCPGLVGGDRHWVRPDELIGGCAACGVHFCEWHARCATNGFNARAVLNCDCADGPALDWPASCPRAPCVQIERLRQRGGVRTKVSVGADGVVPRRARARVPFPARYLVGDRARPWRPPPAPALPSLALPPLPPPPPAQVG